MERNRTAAYILVMNQKTVQRPARGAAVLQADLTRSIWRAAVLELARTGYDRLSMESVARRAGVGKAALYRRWSGKEAMIVELITGFDLVVSASDMGSLEADVRDYAEKGLRLLRRPLSQRILPDLYAQVSRDTLLSSAIRSTVHHRKRQSIRDILDRSIARGELAPQTDAELAFDLLVGPIYWRALVTRTATDGAYLDRLSTAVAASLRAAAPVAGAAPSL